MAAVSLDVPSPRGPRTLALSCTRLGTGEPLLLLHGIGHHRQAWDPVIDILAAERDVIAVDLPGFGASEALPDGLRHGLPAMSTALGALCDTLGTDRSHVAGNPLGGLLALEPGREKRIRSVTALSPAGFWTPVEQRYAFGILTAMRRAARGLPLPVVERLSRSAAGRAVLTSNIYARPGRRSPEAVVAETLALARAGVHELCPRRRCVGPRSRASERVASPRCSSGVRADAAGRR
ncbi:pimeloyl-ACP methyl ester carboxylesterase [Streptomyces sp. B3I7]|uniref:alpha/beta fold hydrolase n=1 Tax=Streptomyces sp. B3I7 TaxID=3042269 RepID=UPI00277FB07D|nr:alpha/beta fold hydrolase [Streptomyces sp. B3I7]MDQ0814641.1 pimeloyl-ACP methyl ester carboxylesterase [Streptomyces sp. B3I7]